MRRRLVIILCVLTMLCSLSANAVYSFSSPGNGDFYSPTNDFYDTNWSYDTEFAEPTQTADTISTATDSTAAYDSDYVAVSTGEAVYPDVWAGDITVTYNNFTLPDTVINSDGSIGTINIGKIGLSAKVYEGESIENMDKGVAHFKSTSSWDGNIGLCSHNRSGYFGRLKELKVGDTVTYTTRLGTRTYVVTYTGQIAETDFSYLARSSENKITMITCVENVPTKRLMVQCTEVLQ